MKTFSYGLTDIRAQTQLVDTSFAKTLGPQQKLTTVNCTSGWLNCFFRKFSTVQINGTSKESRVSGSEKNSRLPIKGEKIQYQIG